jgi:hypothetical protein
MWLVRDLDVFGDGGCAGIEFMAGCDNLRIYLKNPEDYGT